MTIKADWAVDDPTIPVVATTETTGIDVESTRESSYSRDMLLESTNSGLGITQAPAALLEILKPPPFLLEDFNETRFVVPADERSLMKIKYWLDIYQLLSMRQLICKATYTDNTKRSMQYTYTCAHDECHDSVWLPRVLSSGRLNKKEKTPHQRLLSLHHTCTPHCQWGAVPPSSAFKPQGFVMSQALRFTIVAQFLYEQVPDDNVLKKICSKDVAASEGLRLQMNRKFGLNVTKEQWKQTLQKVHHHFFSYHFFSYDFYLALPMDLPMDRRDVNELTSWDLWRIYNFKLGEPLRWFEFKVREEDATCMRWLKRIWAFTGWFHPSYFILFFIRLCALSAVFLIFFPFIHLYPILGSWVWCFCGFPVFAFCLIAHSEQSERELYGQEGVEVEGHVSDRWVIKSEENDDDMYREQLTYFETDGTMCNIIVLESQTPNEVYVEPVPMLYLPDRPCSGLPTRILYANHYR